MKKLLTILFLALSINLYSIEKVEIRYIGSFNYFSKDKLNLISVNGIGFNEISFIYYNNHNQFKNYDHSNKYPVQEGFMILYRLPTILNFINGDLGIGYDSRYFVMDYLYLDQNNLCKGITKVNHIKHISVNYMVGVDICKLIKVKSKLIIEPNILVSDSFQPKIGFTLGYKFK